MITLYGYPKCSTCRKAQKALEALNIAYSYIDITENPPSASVLKKIAKQAGLPLKKCLNTSGIQYREQNIKALLPALNDDELAQLLADNGRLIKRPLVTDGKRSTVGYPEQHFNEIWR